MCFSSLKPWTPDLIEHLLCSRFWLMKGSQTGLCCQQAWQQGQGEAWEGPTDPAAEGSHRRPGPWNSLEPEGGRGGPEQPTEVCRLEGDLQEG